MIHLSKDGIRYTNDYNPDCDKYVDQMVDSLIPHLRQEVKLSEDYTLEDLFKTLEKDLFKYNIVFNSVLGHYPLEYYIEDINKPFDPPEDDSIDYLEVYWTVGCESYEQRGYTEWKNSIETSAEFHGWGTWTDDPNSPWPDGQKGGFAIEFTPLKELKHLPLKIKNKTEIILDDGTYEKDEDGFYNSKVLYEGEKYFSVYDFVGAILFEVSYAGSPEQRDESLEKLKTTHEDAKERLADGEEFKSFDELKKESKEKRKE